MIYLATFGMDDPIRDNVKENINLIASGNKEGTKEKGGINIRMVSGDHLFTCLAVALRTNLISEAEKKEGGVALTGQEFRESIGKYQKIWNDELGKFDIEFEDKIKFDKVRSKLRVLARATEEDKLILVEGIRKAGGIVAMSGEGVSDAVALKMADVGLCMG